MIERRATTPPLEIESYWNARLDAVDWVRPTTAPEPERWELARETFLGPATAEAIDALGDLKGRLVLELACGSGCGVFHLSRRGAAVVGFDLSRRRCGEARRQLLGDPTASRAVFCAGNVERLPFGDETFDAVFCRDVLMYADPERVAGECRRVLRPGGRAAFVESLVGPPWLRLYRRWTTSPSYRSWTRHLSWREMREWGAPLERISLRAHYLLSLTAFLALFGLGSCRLHRQGLRWLVPIDRRLLQRFPILQGWAWRAVAILRRADDVRH